MLPRKKAMIHHSKPTIAKQDIEAVLKAVKSGQLSGGPRVREFERRVSNLIGVRDGVATSSGTSALHLALLAMGIGRGDEVIIPSYVCTAVLNAVLYTGARPVLVDIDEEDFNISLADTSRKLTRATKAIVIPHMFGCPADITGFLELGVPVIEDCAQSIGALYKGRPVGRFSHIAIFSFYATKVITTGEGGMAISNSNRYLNRMRDLRGYDKKNTFQLRYNYKMDDTQAALGISQLKRLPQFIRRRKRIAEIYDRFFARSAIRIPLYPQDRDPIYYRYVIRLVKGIGHFRNSLIRKGIDVSTPLYRPLHRYLHLADRDFPVTAKVARSSLSIPIYPSLTDNQVKAVIKAVSSACGSP